MGLHNMPGIPEPSLSELRDTIFKLKDRKGQTEPAENGLSHRYTLGGHTATAKEFVFGGSPPPDLPLEDPKQFAMGWTTYKGVYADAEKHLNDYARTLTDVDYANEQFWPTIAKYGAAYNLLILRKVTDARFAQLNLKYPNRAFEYNYGSIHREGRLYEIDFSIFESLGAWYYHGKPARFNPATLTLLVKDPKNKGVFTPIWIAVWDLGKGPHREDFYCLGYHWQKPGSWLYALQAVKSSVTLYGIWLGHVYHWHMVTAAMQGTWYENIHGDHPLHQLLVRHLDYLTPFDYALLDGAGWPYNEFLNFSTIAPPSRIADVKSFLQLTDKFAAGREFFDDDPRRELARNGLLEADFTRETSWDCYPAAQFLLRIWDICEQFMSEVVDHSYADDHAVAADTPLQNWMKAAADPHKGNLRGLPPMTGKNALKSVLTSLIYRVTAHGVSRLVNTANPSLTFVANFPPCLQSPTLVLGSDDLTTQELLKYLPNTTTIGDMLKFYFAFVFSKPYVPLLPSVSVGHLTPDTRRSAPGYDLYFPGNILTDPRNAALVRFRMAMEQVMGIENIEQWPRNIET